MTRLVAALIVALSATSVAMAPVAVADPASATIDELEAEGYDVQINWVSGSARSGSLADCSVTAVHNPNRSGAPPTTFTTVYVDVSCPERDHDDFGFLWGVGGFF